MLRQCVFASAIAAVVEGNTCPHEGPSFEDRKSDLFQCDRECRWKFNFGDRSIVGKRTSYAGIAENHGNACCCYQLTGVGESPLKLGDGNLIDRTSQKEFDTENTWSGTDTTGFDTVWACVKTAGGGFESMNKVQAKADGREIIHCGKCALCSGLDDVAVLANTRKWITYVMTKTSAKFAAPWGHKNVSLLEKDLFDLAVSFSGPAGPDEEPSCMKCWSDNIMCDARQCVSKCWTKFFDPSPTEECLKCDESTCGPEFIKCAGANRRSTGIVSDITRTNREQCTDGIYYGLTDDQIPTVAQPTDQEINDVCDRNAGPSALEV